MIRPTRHTLHALTVLSVLVAPACAAQIGTAPAPPPRDTIQLVPRPETPPPPEVEVTPMSATEPVQPLALPSESARNAFPVERTLQMRSTAYCLRGTMRTGVRVRDGMAAGDPSVLPLGSVVRVSHPDGRLVGIFVIMDTGGAIIGNKIDLWFNSCQEAREWGVRSVVAEVLDTGRV